jgi:EmrB/QacA subfamily drug resistance transporter
MFRSRWLALVILCTASLMIILDGTIVTVALPTTAADLGFTAGSLSWVMNAYLISFGGLLLLSGRLGDLIGRKRMFLAGIAVFVLASLGCGLAAGPAMLIAARFVQGAGAAMASAVTLGMIARLFSEPAERNRAIGGFAFTGAVGASAGLVIGGLLVQYASWHWIFFVNLPVGIATVVAGWRLLAADQGIGLRAGADVPGAALATSGVMLGVFAIADHQHWWAGLIAAALLAGFAVRQTRLQSAGRTPLLPPRVLASRTVSGANLAQLLIIGAAIGFQVIVTLYLQRALGYRPAAAGLGLLPTAAVIAVVSLGLSARLTSRFGPRRLLLTGLVMITAALAVLTRIPAPAHYLTWLLPALVLFGAGGGLTLPAVTALGMADATDADAGVISGMFNTAQQVGGAFGLALLTSLAAWRTGSGTSAAALTSGYHLALAAGAVLGAASIVVAAVVLRPRRRARGGQPPAAPVAGHVDLVGAAGGAKDTPAVA